ncbi:MAG: LolC, partial [uncultured bacterium]
FSSHIQETLLGFDSNLVIHLNEASREENILKLLNASPDIDFYQNVIEFETLLEIKGEIIGSVKLRGVDFSQLAKQSGIKLYKFDPEVSKSQTDLPLIYLGEDFYSRLVLTPMSQQELLLMNPFGDIGPSGDFVPVSKNFFSNGFFTTGYYDFDSQYGLVDLPHAEKLCGVYCQKSFLVYYKKGVTVARVESDLRQMDPQIKMETWQGKNKKRYQALKLEKLGIFFLLTLVLLIASINIFSLVSLISFKKMKENILLWILGSNKKQIFLIYIYYAAILGFIGSAPAILVGGGVLFYLRYHALPLPAAYYLDTLPVELKAGTFFVLLLLAPIIAILASIWPSIKTATKLPIKMMRENG